jgi:hypothetical protein
MPKSCWWMWWAEPAFSSRLGGEGRSEGLRRTNLRACAIPCPRVSHPGMIHTETGYFSLEQHPRSGVRTGREQHPTLSPGGALRPCHDSPDPGHRGTGRLVRAKVADREGRGGYLGLRRGFVPPRRCRRGTPSGRSGPSRRHSVLRNASRCRGLSRKGKMPTRPTGRRSPPCPAAHPGNRDRPRSSQPRQTPPRPAPPIGDAGRSSRSAPAPAAPAGPR